MIPNRLFILTAGLLGALGVSLSAMAAHRADGANVATAASFFLMHAPAFLALALLGRNRMRESGAWVLFAGLALFSGDLLARTYLGTGLFAFAAPAGGVMMIGGWLLVGASALVDRYPRT
jgi:uncharacterized membrane protein YgdD (TMEM256/DUF423 family)